MPVRISLPLTLPPAVTLLNECVQISDHVTSNPTAIELKVAVTEEIVTDDDHKLRPKWQGPTRSMA